MAYSELIKSFTNIRSYMREFYVNGFKHRTDIDAKSARSYDNERRRIASWLGEYMNFGQDEDGRRTYLSVDSRVIAQNPLYKAFKAKSFTDNDIMLHFYLLDLLSVDRGMTIHEVIEALEEDYLQDMAEVYLDESTIRKKLNEYEALGLVVKKKAGTRVLYTKTEDHIELERWKNAVAYYAETAPLGIVGSYILDKYDHAPDLIRYKHHHIVKALDSEILYVLFDAIGRQSEVRFSKIKKEGVITAIPLRILVSTQFGRQYLLARNCADGQVHTYRLDHIQTVSIGKPVPDYREIRETVDAIYANVWGVSTSNKDELEHVELDITVRKYEHFIPERMQREKRCGTVVQLDAETWRFTADVYDAHEMLPWIRTFIGRIRRFSCSNKKIEDIFNKDMEFLYQIYGIETDSPVTAEKE